MLIAGSSFLGQEEHPRKSPFDAVSSSQGGWKIPFGSKTPIFQACLTPKPSVLGSCCNPAEDEAALCAPLSPKWCLSPPVPVRSKPAGFCPNPAPGPPPARHAGKGPAAPRKNQAGRKRRKWCPVSDATSPRVPVSPSLGGCGSLGGRHGLGGVPSYPVPPRPAAGGWFGLGGVQGGMDRQLPAPFSGVLQGAGRQEGTGQLGVVPPPSPGVVSLGVGQFALGGPVASGSHARPRPDPGREEVTRIWGEKGRGGVRGETGVQGVIPATCPCVPASH